ncbi:MAG: Outer membrane lipoprotein Omp16 [Opitutia bacterium UBA7350]|nr:MAG: Outer membrane lipoprotein Omp16 [Opitutae bacterium UBA7350]
MIHNIRNVFILISAILLLSACTRTQLPTPLDTASGFGGEGFVPGETSGEWNPPAREAGSSYNDGTYNGRPTVVGLFKPVYFNFDSSSIAASEREKLQKAAQYLSKNKSFGILLEGRCDWYGTADYNLALGEQRANSARNYLSTLGINDSRIETLSKGSLEATSGLAKNQSVQDRRVDIIILK